MRTSASGLLLPEPLECAKQSIHLILAQIHQDVKQKTSWYLKRTMSKDKLHKTFRSQWQGRHLHDQTGRINKQEGKLMSVWQREKVAY